MRRPVAMLALLTFLAACADAPVPAFDRDNVPNVAEIVCQADGSTTVRTPQVVVQRDGVHVLVVSRLDEPASVNGFGFDVEPGETTHVSGREPGRIETACWPFSAHGSGDEPPTHPIDVLDPDGTYVSGEVECSGTASAMVADFFEEPLDEGRVPLDVARAQIRGLQPDDEVVHVGYPAQDNAAVAVRRNAAVVATFSFVTFDGDEWQVASNHVCSSSKLR